VSPSGGSPFDLTAEACWPTLLFHRRWRDHAAEAPVLLAFLAERRADQAGRIASGVAVRAKSGHGLYESEFDLFTHSHPALDRLKGFIGQSLAAAMVLIKLALREAEIAARPRPPAWKTWESRPDADDREYGPR